MRPHDCWWMRGERIVVDDSSSKITLTTVSTITLITVSSYDAELHTYSDARIGENTQATLLAELAHFGGTLTLSSWLNSKVQLPLTEHIKAKRL